MHGRRAAWVLAGSVLLAFPALAAEWKLVRANERARLSVDQRSIERKGDEVAFRFLIDLREAEGELRHGMPYRSVVTKAKVRCQARTIAFGEAEVFMQNRGQGVATGRNAPGKGVARFRALEKGSSDEDLWRYLCEPGKKPGGGK